MTDRGLTLVELLVALAVIGVLALVVDLSPAAQERYVDSWKRRLTSARRDAIASGRAVTHSDTISGIRQAWTAYPDGRVAFDTVLAVEPR